MEMFGRVRQKRITERMTREEAEGQGPLWRDTAEHTR